MTEKTEHIKNTEKASTEVDMSAHFSAPKLLRYTAPTVAMMVFTSIYCVVDGFFVSNYVGDTAFAAVNFIMPVIMILSSFGFMVGTGGSAIVANTRGAGDEERASRIFNMLVWFTLIVGIVLAVLGFFLCRPIAAALGAEGEMLEICVVYGRLSMISLPFFTLQCLFQEFFNVAGKPKLGLLVTIISGCANIILDIVLVGMVGLGVPGAAIATIVSEYIGGVVPIVYFMCKNSTPFRLRWAPFDAQAIAKTCVNGSSEMVTNIAMSVVAMVYNFQLLRLLGQDGVAAYGVLEYVGLIFNMALVGYAVGCAPLMSFQNGAGNNVEKRSLLKKSLIIIGCTSVAMMIAGELLSGPIAQLYMGYKPELRDLTTHAFHIYSISFLFSGMSIYASSLFTSLENGVISAIISFVRTLVFEAGMVLLLPFLFGVEAIWYSIVVAEIAAVILAASLFAANARKYGFRD